MTFTVTLDEAVSGGLIVTPSFTDGSATKGTDYRENTAALSFAGTVGETRSFTVATTEDSNEESDETFTVGLTVSGTTATVTATDTARGTILDDDTPAVLTIGDASAGEGDPLIFTVTLDRAVPGGLTVTPSFIDGTAAEGTDYTANTAALTFAGTAGERKTLTVATSDDAGDESDETFTVSLTVSGTTETVTATDTATGTIRDDDTPAVLTIGDASAGEGDPLVFTMTLDKKVPGGLTVTLSFTDGTATEGTDYVANTAPLTFAGYAGETRTLTVATADDSDEEEDETLTVGLTVSGTSSTVTATDTATGTILDDDEGEGDEGENAVAALTVTGAAADEGEPLEFVVTLDQAVSGGVDGYADLHRRHGLAGDRLHPRRNPAPLRRHRGRDADRHRGHDRRRRRRAARDLHRRDDRLGDDGDGDGDRYGHGDDYRQRRERPGADPHHRRRRGRTRENRSRSS